VFRLILAAALSGGLVLGGAGPAAAAPAELDYEDPVVPSQFLLHPAAPDSAAAVPAPVSGGARLLAQGMGGAPLRAGVALDEPIAPTADSAGVFWVRDGAPGGPLRVIPGSQWSAGGGCALWSWNSC
jgi:hypothetical protein